MEERVIFHIDVNNAFLSWTAVYLLKHGYHKDIREVPSVIGGDEKRRAGIVLAKSPVAKKLGVVSAETIYSARKKCKDLEVYPPYYKYYSEKSKELMDYLSKYSPTIEQFSIDECFIDMSGTKYLYNDLIELAHNIKDEIYEKFGYTVNIGIANNKLCAKMASDFEKPNKVHTLFKDEIVSKLWPLDVADLFMCGKSTTKELRAMNINTIGDLARTDKKKLIKHFKSMGEYLYNASRGIDNSKVEADRGERKSISTERTLPKDASTKEELKDILYKETLEVARQLRNKKMYAKTITIIYKDILFKKCSQQLTLNMPCNTDKELYEKVMELFDASFKEEPIRLIGVRLSNLTTTKEAQLSIFDVEEDNKDDKFQETIDKINNKFGKSLIEPAALKMLDKDKYRRKE